MSHSHVGVSHWERVGNFYTIYARGEVHHKRAQTPWGQYIYEQLEAAPFRSVEFRNPSVNAGVSTIIVDGIYTTDARKEIKITLKALGEQRKTIDAILYETRGDSFYRFASRNGIDTTIILNHINGLTNLKSFLRKCNLINVNLFTSELIEELERIINFTFSRDYHQREFHPSHNDFHLLHKIPEFSPKLYSKHDLSHVNPVRALSTELSKLLCKGVGGNLSKAIELYLLNKSIPKKIPVGYVTPLTDEEETSMTKLLINGEDPNQRDEFGLTPIFIALVLGHSPKVVGQLLAYGSDPSNRFNGLIFESALDFLSDLLALQNDYGKEIRKLLIVTTKNRRSLKSTVKKITVSHADDYCVQTKIEFDDGEEVGTDLKAALTWSELNFVRKSTSSVFNVGNVNLSRMMHFAYDFVTNNILFEIIRNKKNELVGFITYQFFISPDRNHIDLYYGLQMVDKSLQGYGLMSVLSGRLAWVLKMLFPDKSIWGISAHVSKLGFDQIMGTLSFPMYQTAELCETTRKLAPKVFNSEPQHDGITWTVGSMQSKSLIGKDDCDFLQRFFEDLRQGKAVLSRWPFGDEIYARHLSMAVMLGIVLLTFIKDTAKHAKPLLSRFFSEMRLEKPLPDDLVVEKSRDMFFSPKVITHAKPEISRAKL